MMPTITNMIQILVSIIYGLMTKLGDQNIPKMRLMLLINLNEKHLPFGILT